MNAAELGFTLIGCVLVVAVSTDIFLTVFHPTVESPLSNRFQQAIWYSIRSLKRITGGRSASSQLLSLGLPLMVAGLIMFWLVLYCVGFACIYYPWIADPTLFNASNPVSGSFFDALYYSGITLATLGYGDIQPLTAPFRMLAVLEAVVGAVTISAAVAYILSVYPALTQQRTIARALNAEVAGHSDAIPMLRRYMAADGHWHNDLFRQMRELALALLNMSESHETHSVLYYAHPRHIQHSFLRVLVTAQSLIAMLRYGLSIDQYADVVKHPHILLLEQSLRYSLHHLVSSIHVADHPDNSRSERHQELSDDFAELCTKIEDAGLVSARLQRSAAVPVLIGSDADDEPTSQAATNDDEPNYQAVINDDQRDTFKDPGGQTALDPALDLSSFSPAEAYIEFRLQTDPLIEAYARACGYRLADARATYATNWWTGPKRKVRRF